jgi:hypothetical protein
MYYFVSILPLSVSKPEKLLPYLFGCSSDIIEVFTLFYLKPYNETKVLLYACTVFLSCTWQISASLFVCHNSDTCSYIPKEKN